MRGASLYIKIAWRNIWRHTRRTLIVMLTIAIGLMMLVFYDGFVAGMKQAIFGNAVRLFGGNVQIHAPGYLLKSKRTPMLPLAEADEVVAAAQGLPNVVSVAKRINTGGMLSNEEGTFPVVITGIELTREESFSLIAKNISAGRFLGDDDHDVILIGKALAERMEVTLGDRILLTGRGVHDKMRQRTMTIIGIYDLGLPAVEKNGVYLSLVEAQNLFGLRGEATEVVVALTSVGQEGPIVDALSARLPQYEVASWESTNAELKQMLEVNESTMAIFSLAIAAIAGIGVLNLLLMAVFERTREIGLLGALGLKGHEIMALFLLEGAMLGMLGSLLGVALGYLLTAWVGKVGIDYGQVTETTEFTALMGRRAYTAFDPNLTLHRALMTAIVSTLAAIYPAREASRHEPAESLHHV